MRLDRLVPPAARALLVLALVALAPWFAGCSSSPLPTAPPRPLLGYVTLIPGADTLAVAGTRLFVAAAFDTDSVAVSGPRLTWTSSNPAVCTVASNGLVTALAEGVAAIIATGNGAADTASIFVYTQNGWYAQTSSTSHPLRGVFFQADGRHGVAVGDAGTVVVTANAGATWMQRTSGTSAALHAVWFTHADTGWAVGNAGTVLRSTNGGVSWTRQLNVAASENLRAVRFVGTRHGWIVGASGVVLRTRNGGVSWTRSSPTAFQLNAVAFSDTLNGWAAGTGGIVVGTHDGGASWYIVQPSLTAQPLAAAWRRGNTSAWVMGAQGTLLRTGATADSLAWSASSLGAGYQLNAVQLVTATVGYAAGSNSGGAVLKSTTSGVTWTPQVANTSDALNGVYFVDALRGWAVGDAGRIVHTSNGGTP